MQLPFVLVMLIWSSDGSAFQQYLVGNFITMDKCEAVRDVRAQTFKYNPQVELLCSETKYYERSDPVP